MLRASRRLVAAASASGRGRASSAAAKGSVEDEYRQLTPVEHVLARPETYVGPVQRTGDWAPQWVAPASGGVELRRDSFSVVPALFK